MAEFNYVSCLSEQWNYPYPPGAFQCNPGQYLQMCSEVYPQVANEGPAFLRVKEAKSLAEMEGAVEILAEEVTKSKENIAKELQQEGRAKVKKGSGRFCAPLSELELNAMFTPFVPRSIKSATSWSVNM